MVVPDWFLDRIYPYTHQVKIKIETLATSKTILSMNSATIKLIAVGITGCVLGYFIGRIYLPVSALPPPPPPSEPAEPAAEIISDKKDSETAPTAEPAAEPAAEIILNKKDSEPAPTAEPPAEPADPNKFDPILGENNEIIGFMYKIDALRKSLTIPKNPTTNFKKIGYEAFPKTRDLLL